MSVWNWLGHVAEGGAGAVGALFDWVTGAIASVGDASARRQVAFSVALIALSAKMAKADGVVTAAEVGAFRGIFVVPAGQERHVAHLFDLAKRDVAGYDAYAARIAAIYAGDPEPLSDVLDGLFTIAKADGAVHEAEYAYLRSVAEIFGLSEEMFERLAARHVVGEEGDPYVILGVARGLALADYRARYRALVAESHPDRAIARGMPPEFIAIANERMAAINRAWQRIALELG